MAPSAARARWAGGGGPAAARVLRVAREEAPGAGAGAGAGAGGQEWERRYPEARGRQAVWRVRDVVTGAEALFNEVRSGKPRGFRGGGLPAGGAASGSAALDPLASGGPGRCDFCEWERMTAADSFGRVELPRAVTASNLFRLGAHHGLCLFKRHEPLGFDRADLGDVLEASQRWFEAARTAGGGDCPFFLWNCLPRAGASQFHGHAQLLLGREHLPQPRRLWEGDARHRRAYGVGYLADLAEAHGEFGVAHCVSSAGGAFPSSSRVFPSLVPLQDMELNVVGPGLRDPSFQEALFQALRFLIDDCSVTSFGACVYSEAVDPTSGRPVLARVVSRGASGAQSSDFGSLEVFGGASVGKTDPFALSDRLGEFLRATCAGGAVSPARSGNHQERGMGEDTDASQSC